MLNWIVGPIDFSGAAVLLGLFAAVAVCVGIFLNRPDRAANTELAERKLSIEDRQFEMVKKFEHEQLLAKIAANREIEVAKIDHRTIEGMQASNRDADHG